MRRLPLATIFVEMQRHAEQVLLRIANGPSPDSPVVWGDGPSDDLIWQQQYKAAASVFGAQRGRRPTQSLLEEVARI
jgi:hypothetical protein